MRKLLYIFLLMGIISCSSETKNTETNETNENTNTKNIIVLTKEQIKIAGIETGKIEKRKISETIQCSGTVEVPPQNIASVSPVMGGFINSLKYYPGNKVEKGAVIATLNHPNFINLQKQYIEAKSRMEYFQEEYKRQGELTVENAASIKNMQKAKADYLSSEAEYKSLKSQLKVMGVNLESIEKGDFLTEFKILSPISGTISQLEANKGKYVNPDECIYEIINDNQLNLCFNVFEKDISKVKNNQQITFSLLNDSKKYNSKISRIGAKVNNENRTVLVQGNFNNTNRELKLGMHILASIYINEHEVDAIPSEAIVKSDNKSFIFIKENETFKPIKIEPGIEQNNFTELKKLNKDILNSDIVVKGAYYLVSAMEVEE